VAEQRAEDRVGIGLAQAAEAQRPVADRRLERVRAVGAEEVERVERREQLEAGRHPRLPAAEPLVCAGDGVQRQAAPEEQRVADPHALVAAGRQPEGLTQRHAGRQEVEPRTGGRVDRRDGLAPEAQDRAGDAVHVARRVERRDELRLRRIGAAPLVQRDELLVAGLCGDVDAAVPHGDPR
jgi:hypothetical protein